MGDVLTGLDFAGGESDGAAELREHVGHGLSEVAVATGHDGAFARQVERLQDVGQ